MSMVPLPPTLALFSWENKYYVNYTDDSDSSVCGFLRVNGSNVFSPLAKLEVLFANIGTGVHLRCRKNRKFLRRRTSTSTFISPDADEPEEDTSKWGCTLFEPQGVTAHGHTNLHAKFRLVSTGQYVTSLNTSGVRALVLLTSDSAWSVFSITDLETVLVLPKYVAFKAENSKYLRVRDASEWWVSVFTSNDKGISQCRYQTTTNGHGDVYLKSIHHNKYLRCEADVSRHNINADSDQPSQYGYFRPIKIDAITMIRRESGGGTQWS